MTTSRLISAGRTIPSFLLTGVAILAVMLVAFVLIGPRLGFSTHPVLSGSMEPALGTGDVIITQLTGLEEIQKGDVITFQDQSRLVTHRVVEILHREGDPRPWFRTKGDANNQPDSELVTSKSGAVPKTVYHIPQVGYLASMSKDRAALTTGLGILALAVFVIGGREIARGVAEERAKASRKATDS